MSRVMITFTTASAGSSSLASRLSVALLLLGPEAMAALRCSQGREQDLQAPGLGGAPLAPSQNTAGAPKVYTVAALAVGRSPLQVQQQAAGWSEGAKVSNKRQEVCTMPEFQVGTDM
jgi:hypothetical protein